MLEWLLELCRCLQVLPGAVAPAAEQQQMMFVSLLGNWLVRTGITAASCSC
jgi:hypothetical protein